MNLIDEYCDSICDIMSLPNFFCYFLDMNDLDWLTQSEATPSTSTSATLYSNPWQVDDIATFSYFCCPECMYRAKTVPDFQVHAIINHPDSKDFFERYGDKFWDEHGEDNLHNIDDEPIKVNVS